ncbi:hypothetical protein ACJ73_07299 [Blastomyces percursus]|uniref:Uncharacterized protein n=1 Tax=Blastomyces percursus TaxID=1658174 RepID=A0A1J9R184_9EURO|nr:hypothetical protein ACJ73_07299 [Blastomyces percursus]
MRKLKKVKQRQRRISSDLNQSIRENLAASKAAKKDEQARKEDAKFQRAILKEQREADLIQQRMEREAARQAAKQQKEMDKAARAAQRQIDKELRDSRKAEQKEKEERAAAQLQSQLPKITFLIRKIDP